jgi:hypothetical protein
MTLVPDKVDGGPGSPDGGHRSDLPQICMEIYRGRRTTTSVNGQSKRLSEINLKVSAMVNGSMEGGLPAKWMSSRLYRRR